MHNLFKSILGECWWRLYRAGQARYQAAGQCSPNPRPLLCPARSSHQQLSPTSSPACSHVTRPSQSQHRVHASANLAVLLTSVSTPSMNKIYTKYEYYLQGGNCIHMRKPDAVAVWGFRSPRTSYVSLNSSATSRGLWGCMQNIFVINKQRNFFPAQAKFLLSAD